MGLPGPAPLPNPIRRNQHDTSHLEEQHDVPPILKQLRGRTNKTIATQRWWEVWATSEQAKYFMPTDWLRLQQIAILVERLFRMEEGSASPNGMTLLMAEIRQNEGLFGATILDRMRLKLRATEGEKGKKPPTVQGEMAADDDLYEDLSN